MNKTESALRMALEALEIGKPMFDAYWGGSQFDQAITAIKEVLAQPEKDIPKIGCVNHDCDKCKTQPEQEPVAWIAHANVQLGTHDGKPLQRTWVGLSEDDYENLANHFEADTPHPLVVRYIENKLREKNT